MIKTIVKTPIVGWYLFVDDFFTGIFQNVGDPFGEIQLELTSEDILSELSPSRSGNRK